MGPRANLVGEVNRGWYVGMATLDFERSAIGTVASIRRDLEELVEVLNDEGRAIAPSVRNELADRRIESHVIHLLSLRILSMQERGMVPNYEASIAKICTSELNQRIARTALKALGLSGQAIAAGSNSSIQARCVHHYLRTVANTIEGGSSEIQRNIIATRGVGLPRG